MVLVVRTLRIRLLLLLMSLGVLRLASKTYMTGKRPPT